MSKCKLTVLIKGRGTVSPPAGIHDFDRGSRVYVSALADFGWRLDGWSGDVLGRDSTRILTMNSDKKVIACFQPRRIPKPVAAPASYIANPKSGEIHLADCRWVTKMKEINKIPLFNLKGVFEMVKNGGYNGCYYCLRKYDRDTLTDKQVLENLEADLPEK